MATKKAAAKAETADEQPVVKGKTSTGKDPVRVPKGPSAKKSTGTPPKEEKVAAADAKTSTKGPAKALGKPVTPSKDLAAIVGAEPLPRTAVVSRMWEYIHAHNLQNPADKREILADDKLKVIFGKDKATMFELNKLLSSHLV